MMQTLTAPFLVKKPEAELEPPKIGKNGGMSLGAHHVEGVGAVMSIAIHHPDGTTLVATFGWEGYAEFCHSMNALGARISSGEFKRPPVPQ
jgi:hypothetical protein